MTDDPQLNPQATIPPNIDNEQGARLIYAIPRVWFQTRETYRQGMVMIREERKA